MSKPKLVFVSKDVATARKMSVTALMNRFCARGYDVTLISDTFGNHNLNFRCDHRLKRLSLDMGVKNRAPGAEVLANFVSRLPESVYILTDFDHPDYPAVIKSRPGNKVVCLLENPSEARGFYADVFVSNTECGRALHENGVYIPYFYPYGAGEYRAAPPGGASILLCGHDPLLLARAREKLAGFPLIDEDGKDFDALARDCALVVVAEEFAWPGLMYVLWAARQIPVLFASDHPEPAFFSIDQCAEAMANPADYLADLSEEAAARTFAQWEALVADTAAARFDAIPMPARKPPGPRALFERKIYYRERRRALSDVPLLLSPEQVRKAQLLASKLLLAFERVCKKHGLRYYVSAGSLLGAARHGGPIPWDDDVDVTMPRPDYERFIRVAQSELPADMVLPERNFPYGFHRMQIRGTEITRQIRQKGPHGVFLDILPLDGAAPTPRLKKLHGRLNRILLNCMNAKARPLPLMTLHYLRVYECIKRLVIKCFAPGRLLFWLWKRVATWYDTAAAAEWVCLPGIYGYESECFPKEYWGEPVYLPYEGREVPVMREWEKYLTAHYGDYRMPPPVLARRTHYLFAIDFGKYEGMTVEEIEKEVEAYGKAQ